MGATHTINFRYKDIMSNWSDFDTVRLMQLARTVYDGFVGIGEALEEFNVSAEVKRGSLRALEQKAHQLQKKLGGVKISLSQKRTVEALKRFENLCRAERRRASKMTQGNPFAGMKMTNRPITEAERLQLKKKLAATGVKAIAKKPPTLEQRVARLESMVEDAMNVIERVSEALR